MPPRKSNVSTISHGGDESLVGESTAKPARTPKEKNDDKKNGLSVEDLSLPRSIVGRLAKGVLPPNTQIHKDALLALHKSATVFVSYIASNSNDNAQANGKKTIAPQDVIAALKEVELEGFIPRLEAELKKYNDKQSDKRTNYRRKVKEEKAAAAIPSGDHVDDSEMQHLDETSHVDTTVADGDHEEAEGSGPPPSKKRKGANGATSAPAEDDDDEEDDDEDAAEDDDDSDDGIEATEDAEEDGDEDENMEEEDDEDDEDEAVRNELQDEALDEPDSD